MLIVALLKVSKSSVRSYWPKSNVLLAPSWEQPSPLDSLYPKPQVIDAVSTATVPNGTIIAARAAACTSLRAIEDFFRSDNACCTTVSVGTLGDIGASVPALLGLQVEN